MKKHFIVGILTAFALTACGEDAGPVSDAGASVDSSANDAAQNADAGTSDCANPARVLVTTSDYTTGGLCVVDLAAGTASCASDANDDQDSVPRYVGCRAYVIERGLGNIDVQSESDPLVTERTISVNQGASGQSNPQDVVALPDGRVLVTRLYANSALVVDPTLDEGGDAVEVDLSGFLDESDSDGYVDMSDAEVIGDRVYIALGRYFFDDDFAQQWAGSSLVAVVDAATLELVDMNETEEGVQGIELTFHNPTQLVALPSDVLAVVAGGAYGAEDGGAEMFMLPTGTRMASYAETLTGDQLAGIVPVSSSIVYAVRAGFTPQTMQLASVNLTTEAATTLVTENVIDAKLVGEELVVGTTAGLLRHNAASGAAISTTPIATGALPTYGMVAVP